MAWSTPLTAVSNSALTASQWNASIRDNLLETAVAKATTAGSHFAATGTNALAERIPAQNAISTAGTTTSTSYITNLTTAGTLSVNATCGVKAVWSINSSERTSVNGNNAWAAVSIFASSISASDFKAISYDQGGDIYHGLTVLEDAMTAGLNTFTMAHRVTGTATAFYSARRIQVVPF